MSNLQQPAAKQLIHVDEFIDYHFGKDCYARWVLMYFCLPAVLQIDFAPFMKEHKLFCTYQGKRYRCIGASRMGDVWLTENLKSDSGYSVRPNVADCSDWGPEE